MPLLHRGVEDVGPGEERWGQRITLKVVQGGVGRAAGRPGIPQGHAAPPSPAAPRGRPAPSGWDTPLGSAPGTVTDTLGRLGSLKARSAQVTSSAAARWSLPAPGVT